MDFIDRLKDILISPKEYKICGRSRYTCKEYHTYYLINDIKYPKDLYKVIGSKFHILVRNHIPVDLSNNSPLFHCEQRHKILNNGAIVFYNQGKVTLLKDGGPYLDITTREADDVANLGYLEFFKIGDKWYDWSGDMVEPLGIYFKEGNIIYTQKGSVKFKEYKFDENYPDLIWIDGTLYTPWGTLEGWSIDIRYKEYQLDYEQLKENFDELKWL